MLSFFIFSGNFDAFMQKEIFEQPESVVNTMRGRICFETNRGDWWSDLKLNVLFSQTKADKNRKLWL